MTHDVVTINVGLIQIINLARHESFQVVFNNKQHYFKIIHACTMYQKTGLKTKQNHLCTSAHKLHGLVIIENQ